MPLDLVTENLKKDTQDSKSDTTNLSAPTLSDLISCMEIAAYSLVRSGSSSAAQTIFLAVADLEKVKSLKRA